MKWFLLYLALVGNFVSFGEARHANLKDDGYVGANGYIGHANLTRKQDELNKLYEVAQEIINDIDIVRSLIETNATGLLHGNPATCLPDTQAHGINTIHVPGLEPFPVFCDTHIAGAGWIVIQRRIDGNINFYRNWTHYKHGFGNISEEFFIGMDKLHALTASAQHELYIHLEDFDGVKRHARYEDFLVFNEAAAYNLSSVGRYSGDAGDSLSYSVGAKFSTYDRNNVQDYSLCAERGNGAWWYKPNCGLSSLNGLYLNGVLSKGHYEKGIYWDHWRGSQYSYKTVQMMIRPKCYLSYEDVI